MAAELSEKHGWIDSSVVTRTKAILQSAGLPITLNNIFIDSTSEYDSRLKELSAEKFIDFMSMDKKVADGQLSLVVLKGQLGNCAITDAFEVGKLRSVVEE